MIQRTSSTSASGVHVGGEPFITPRTVSAPIFPACSRNAAIISRKVSMPVNLPYLSTTSEPISCSAIALIAARSGVSGCVVKSGAFPFTFNISLTCIEVPRKDVKPLKTALELNIKQNILFIVENTQYGWSFQVGQYQA